MVGHLRTTLLADACAEHLYDHMLVAISLCLSWTLRTAPPLRSSALRAPAVRMDSDRCYYGAVGEDGSVMGKVARDWAEVPKLSPSLSATDVIDAQFELLSRGTFESVGEAHSFVSPEIVEKWDIDATKFRAILSGSRFDGLIGCDSWTVLGMEEPADDLVNVRLRVIPKPVAGCVRTSGLAGQEGITWPTYYTWQLRKQAAEPYADCWMLEQMLPNPPPIEVESADATLRVAQAAE